MRSCEPIVTALALLLVPGLAHARDPREAVVVGGAAVFANREDWKLDPAIGASLGVDLQPENDEPLLIMAGGFGAFAVEGKSTAPERRDIYDLRFDIGIRLDVAEELMPFAAAGVDLLSIADRRRGDDGAPDQVARGTTLGANIMFGIASWLGEHVFVRMDASFIWAVVAGTGDPLDSLVLSLAIGAGQNGPRRPETPPPVPPGPTPPPPPPPPQRPGSPLPPEAAGPAGGRLGCPADQIGVLSTRDERTSCADPAGCLLYRVLHVSGCGRDAEVRCYPGATPEAPLSCLSDPAAVR